MSYLLDTCTLSEYLKKKPNDSVISWMSEQNEDALFLSVLTIGEIKKGIVKIENLHPEKARLLSQWLKSIDARFTSRILPIDQGVIDVWATMCGEALKHGQKLPVIDSLIAATCRYHDLSLVTRNIKDFLVMNVTLINPWREGQDIT
ncbi:type II toxin-antitoxin system VapC family toxin [Spirulina major]|uniref:type II toxin-antitoxin system VapC family toxin n=1 Tax=Spirulina major TaxID=270636 RepID=UPI000933D28B|nr:type II toxin-antitoxin system VapC family toxin [Spirulina major]